MPYFKTCPLCGANLDPCEKCDCTDEKMPPAREAQDGKSVHKKDLSSVFSISQGIGACQE